MNDDRLERMEQTIEKIHRTVISIENVHGAKLEALADGLGVANERLDRLEHGQEAIKAEQQAMKEEQQAMKAEQQAMRADVRDIKRTAGLLHSIANDHESRLQELESGFQDHLSNHP